MSLMSQSTERLLVARDDDTSNSTDFFFNRRESERNFTGMQNNIFNERDNILQFTQLVGLLSSTIQAVLSAQIQFRYLYLQQMSTLKGGMSYEEKIILNDQTLGEL